MQLLKDRILKQGQNLGNGILKVEYNNQNNSINNVNAEVTVYTPDFEKLSASSAGQIFINDDFQLNKLKINLDSAGKVMGNIFAEKLFVSKRLPNESF